MTLNRLTTLNGLDPFSFRLGELVRAEKPQAKTGLKAVAGKPFLFLDIGTGAMQYLPPEPGKETVTVWLRSDDCLPNQSGWYESYLASMAHLLTRGVARWFDHQAKTWSEPGDMDARWADLEHKKRVQKRVQVAGVPGYVFHWIDNRLTGPEWPESESLIWNDAGDNLPAKSGWYEAWLGVRTVPSSMVPDRGSYRYFNAKTGLWSYHVTAETQSRVKQGSKFLSPIWGRDAMLWTGGAMVGHEWPDIESLVEATPPTKPEPIKASDRSPVKSGWYPCSITLNPDEDIHRYFRAKDQTWSTWVRLGTSEESRVGRGHTPSVHTAEALTWIDARKEDWASPFPEDEAPVTATQEAVWVDIEVEAPAKSGWYCCNTLKKKSSNCLRYYELGTWSQSMSPRDEVPSEAYLCSVKRLVEIQGKPVYWLKGSEPL